MQTRNGATPNATENRVGGRRRHISTVLCRHAGQNGENSEEWEELGGTAATGMRPAGMTSDNRDTFTVPTANESKANLCDTTKSDTVLFIV